MPENMPSGNEFEKIQKVKRARKNLLAKGTDVMFEKFIFLFCLLNAPSSLIIEIYRKYEAAFSVTYVLYYFYGFNFVSLSWQLPLVNFLLRLCCL